jgi:hypothetical protein
MTRVKIFGAGALAALALSAVGVDSASAAPGFVHTALPLSLTGFTGKSTGPVTIADPTLGTTTKCSKEELAGELEFGSTTHVEEVVIKFKGCTTVLPGTKKIKCRVKSPGQPAGTVKTKRLDGNLGEVLAVEAADERGLDLKPEIGTVVTVVETTTPCPPATSTLEGSIIGEVTPTGGPETLDKTVVATVTGGKQTIQKLVAEPKDTLIGPAASEVTVTSTVTLKFGEIVEVT